MTDTDPARVVEAARRARTVFPGPIGETIAEYLCAWADFGHRFAPTPGPRRWWSPRAMDA